MKICLYLEFYHFWGGFLFRKIGTGLLSSYRNQKAILESAAIPYVERWDDSCDILQINTPWLKSLYLIRRARRQGKKVVLWAHVTAEDIRGVFWFGSLVAPLMKKYLAFAYGSADLVLCPSAYTKSLLVDYGLPSRRLRVQSNGVDLRKFYNDAGKKKSARARYGLRTLTVGTVGLVIPRKGTKTFLGLAEQFPENQFVWFGKVYSPFLAKPLPRSLPPNVRITGFVEDILEAYNGLDIFIFPSHEENQGMVILEAAAVGLPILVRDIPAYQGWLEHDVNCLKAQTDQEFAVLLRDLIGDQALRERLGASARQLAQNEALVNLGNRLRAEYERLLAK